MDLDALATLLLAALQLALVIALPALLASLAAGALMGLVQAATQIQDAALAFVPRLLAVGVALWLSSGMIGERMVGFTDALMRELPKVAQTQ